MAFVDEVRAEAGTIPVTVALTPFQIFSPPAIRRPIGNSPKSARVWGVAKNRRVKNLRGRKTFLLALAPGLTPAWGWIGVRPVRCDRRAREPAARPLDQVDRIRVGFLSSLSSRALAFDTRPAGLDQVQLRRVAGSRVPSFELRGLETPASLPLTSPRT